MVHLLSLALVCLGGILGAQTSHSGQPSEADQSFGSHHMPIQGGVVDVEPMSPDFNLSAPSEVRVKIFPHNQEKYNSPQGADKTWERVTFRTAGTCSTFKAEDDTSQNPKHAAGATSSSSTLVFNAATLPYPVWVKCTAPPQLVRVGFEKKVLRYPGKFFVKVVKPGKRPPYITVVNVISENQYLKGVVPAEMPASWPAEALKVQAIAARTYFRYELATDVASTDPQLLVERSGAQLDDTVMYQAYLGIFGQASSDQAVDSTANQVMNHNGQIIKAYFSADSGGHTENAENVWGVPLPYAVGKAEIYPEGSIAVGNWTSVKSFRDIQQRLLARGLILAEKTIVGVSATSFYTFGRVKQITLKYANGSTEKVGGLDFQQAVGLRSNWFTISNVKGGVQLRGKGFGHGVGMNQWGTRLLVSQYNKSYREILQFYYTNVKIEVID